MTKKKIKKKTKTEKKKRYYVEQGDKIEVKMAHSVLFTGIVKCQYRHSFVLETDMGETLLNKDYVVWIKRINNGKKKRS